MVPVFGKTTAPLANGTEVVGMEMRRGAVVVLVKFKPLLGTEFVSWLISRCCKTGKFCRALGRRVVCAGKLRARTGNPDAKFAPKVGTEPGKKLNLALFSVMLLGRFESC